MCVCVSTPSADAAKVQHPCRLRHGSKVSCSPLSLGIGLCENMWKWNTAWYLYTYTIIYLPNLLMIVLWCFSHSQCSLWCIPIFGQIHSCLHLAPFWGGIYWTKYSSTMEYRDLDLRELEAHGGYYGMCFPIKHRVFPVTCWIATWATLYMGLSQHGGWALNGPNYTI